MKLSDFIRADIEPILDAWERFARSVPSASGMRRASLRDHARGILQAIAADLDRAQSREQQSEKAQGRAPHPASDTEAELHGAGRMVSGFSVSEGLSEFRALRASVMRLWSESSPSAPPVIDEDLVRFNEAIDQALAESIARYSSDKVKTSRLFDTLLSSLPDLNFILDTDGNFIYANKAMADLYGIVPDTLATTNIGLINGPIAGIRDKLREVVEAKATYRAEMQRKVRKGLELTYEYLLAPVVGPDGSVDAVAGMVRDITERKAYEENIKRGQNFDVLTGLPNRSLFRDRLQQEIRRAERSHSLAALLYIDLDGFKAVNDRLGHDVGDRLLQLAAQRIQSCVRATDSVARMGGDEFTVILSGANDVPQVEIVAQEILDRVGTVFTIDAEDVIISASIGIAVFPMDGTTPARLLGNADQAMYVAKQAGRNRFGFYTADMREAAWARRRVIEDLRHALDERQMCVHYQPIVELSVGRIVKAEALLRWQHPRSGLLLPAAFIGLAEDTGLICEIDDWVLGQAVKRAREWSALLGMAFQVSVNTSPSEFMGREPMKCWDTHLARLPTARTSISIEVTEQVLLNASPTVVDKLKALHEAGVQLALDRFGTGYSSMSCLKDFDVDYLKLDRSLVNEAVGDTDQRAVAEAAIVMAHMLGVKVIAEGVESIEQRDWLKSAGCDYAQGHYFSDPLPGADFTALLRLRTPAPVQRLDS
ncbi:putative bifunctional diguanylate cyclase/phosphodiesterase [Cognatiluteimonas profundi]|uniref:putative bifunctional diguanylate cyclase/phosphodiesterase n=1 Tax=Cognatiluteimonas profundi TaxID=2594501 RepID=UPI00131BF79F|nr:EAL domain-containing protein [Lysobacter profundi]